MITRDDIEKLATLARIKVSDDEKESLTAEVGSILAYVDQIKKATVAMDAEGDASAGNSQARAGILKNVTRPDIARTLDAADREAILAAAPDREGDFIAVKKIIAQD